MRPISQWLSTMPNIDEDTERPARWYNRMWEWCSHYDDYRWRLIAGDIAVDEESNSGEPAGAALTFDVRLWEDTGQFDADRVTAGGSGITYHDHSVSFVVWRWGAYLAWRGARKLNP